MRRRRVFHLVVGAFAVIDLLHRIWRMVTDGARPIDWIVVIVDFLVLLAILWFELPEWLHKRKARRIRKVVFDFIQRGQKLQAVSPQGTYAPEGPHGPQFTPAWINLVQQWNQEAVDFMETCSPQARWAFLSDTTDGAAHAQQALAVPSEAKWMYRTMLTRLDNLQSIAEKPDIYL